MKKTLRTCLLLALASFSSHGIVQAERIVLVAGGGQEEPFGQSALQVRLKEPFGVGFDPAGNMFIVEMAAGNRLLKMDPQGRLHHVAGRGTLGDGGDGGDARQAQFNGAHNLAVLPNGNVLIADTWNGRIRKYLASSRQIESLPGFDVGTARGKQAGPYCISLNPAATYLYVADLRQVHQVDVKSGTKKIVAGDGSKRKPPEDVQAIAAPLVDPRAVAVDRLDNIYILERGGNALRVVDRTGHLRTVVNASGRKGRSGDGGPALEATLNGPKHLCLDAQNNVIIADAENDLIRKYIPATGLMERVAGSGERGQAGLEGPPEEVQLARPHGVTVHPRTGELYIVDSYNDRILKIVE